MRKTLALSWLFMVPLIGHAAIYKWQDENGNTVFSDQPRERAQKVETGTPQTFRPSLAPPPAETPAVTEATGTLYSGLAIASPANDAAIRDNAGNVTISITITPALDTASGHYLTVMMDGTVVADRVTAASVSLTNVDRGTHSVQAQIRNAAGNVLRTSATSVFHLQRISINR